MITTFRMAVRGLLRNKRRTFFSMLALAIGVALVLFVAAMLRGEMDTSRDSMVRLESGHLQIQMAGYERAKASLSFADLIAEPQSLSSRIAAEPYVAVATPRLVASGIVNTVRDAVGVRIVGIDPASPASEPFLANLQAGNAISAEDRDGLMMGASLAKNLGLEAGDLVELLVNTEEGAVSEQVFTIRGLFNTGFPSFDRGTVFLPLAKAQTLTGVGERASLIYIILKDGNQIDQAAAVMQSRQYKVLTFGDLNPLFEETERMSSGYMVLIYLIVLGVTATVIINTLFMSVFERTREIGILSAIGMKGRRIMTLFLSEAFIIACGGVALGLLFGVLLSWYGATVGYYLGEYDISGFLLSERLYAHLTVEDATKLVLLAFAITLVGAIYPAATAAGMNPVDAMRGGKLE